MSSIIQESKFSSVIISSQLCGLGLGWVVEDDLTDDVLKKAYLASGYRGLGFSKSFHCFAFIALQAS